MKECLRCHKRLPLHSFVKDSTNKDGRTGECYDCAAARERERRQRTPGVYRDTNARSWAKGYGLTLEQYRERQARPCEACGKVPTESLPSEQDHDHKTGSLRGVLCKQCNILAGYLENYPERVELVAAYLLKYAPVEVGG